MDSDCAYSSSVCSSYGRQSEMALGGWPFVRADKGTDRDLVYHATLEFVSVLTLLYSISVKCGPIYDGVRSNVSRLAFYNMSCLSLVPGSL